MNNTGNKKSGYLVALLLVVGLAAFSNSMRELAEFHRSTLDTGRVIAQYVAPAEAPQIPQVPQVVVAKLNTCDRRQAVPTVGVEWLEDVEGITEPGAQLKVPAPPVKVAPVAPRVKAKISGPADIQLAKIDKFRQFDFHTQPFEFKIPTDDNDTLMQLPVTMFKARNRKQNVFKLNTRDREMILRTLNRSINLRTAS